MEKDFARWDLVPPIFQSVQLESSNKNFQDMFVKVQTSTRCVSPKSLMKMSFSQNEVETTKRISPNFSSVIQVDQETLKRRRGRGKESHAVMLLSKSVNICKIRK